MGRSKQSKYKKKDFESTGKSDDTSSNIYESMLKSPAFQDLTARQVRLYLCMKSQYYAQTKKPPNRDPGDDGKERSPYFYFNKAKWRKDGEYSYKLYSNGKSFKQDVKALAEHGFIEVIVEAWNLREKNVYRYSDKWKEWKPKPP